ncbi:MAG TPA: hypothetical protein DEQ56_08315 [Bacteroidetes bacterium]|nr:hypothetical protein [Bacteroidota bacterium]
MFESKKSSSGPISKVLLGVKYTNGHSLLMVDSSSNDLLDQTHSAIHFPCMFMVGEALNPKLLKTMKVAIILCLIG